MNSKFTLVSTVFNEFARLHETIRGLENQTLKPSEIIITDAGSTDGTYNSLLNWKEHSRIPIVILQEKGANVARGRNLAIKAAKHELIASTDFGCTFHQDWLKSIISPFSDQTVKVVGGAYGVDEALITSLPAKANYILCNGYQVQMDDQFIPSSRSIAYYKSVWEDLGGYPEQLTLAGDDLVFGLELKRAGYGIHLARETCVFWGRHTTLKSYLKEAERYGLGDGEARTNVRNTISTIIELVCRYVFFLALTLFIIKAISPEVFLLCATVGLFGLRSYFRALRFWLRHKSKKYGLLVFLYSLGMIEQLRWRYLNGFYQGWKRKNGKI